MIKIRLESKSIWNDNVLGEFDESSSLADQIDSDNNGVITKSEMQAYNQSHKSYSVINSAETPDDYKELNELAKKAGEAYSGMEQEALEIEEENASFMSQLNDLIAKGDSKTALQKAKNYANSIDNISKDFDATTTSVDKAMNEAKKKSFAINWIVGDALIKKVLNKLEDKSDEVKQNIDKVHKQVDSTEKTVESKFNKDGSGEQKKTTEKKDV